jgi:hypothetical protein
MSKQTIISEEKVSKRLMSFNETGRETSKMRSCILQYLENKECQSSDVKYYRMKHWESKSHYGIKYEQLVISATSRLQAIFKFKEYFNEHCKCPVPFDHFIDDSLDDIVSGYDDITNPEDPESVFKSKNIKEIIDKFVEGEFNNDSLWLEECDAPDE